MSGTSKPKPRKAETVLHERRLQISGSVFWCPYCRKEWSRGGHKEGFVKSGASNHVALCYEIVLFRLGFILGPWLGSHLGGERSAVPIAEATEPWMKRNIRAVKAGIRSRDKHGLSPRLPAGERP
jgi:hypothetical protein